MQLTDYDLVQKCLEGKHEYFSELVKRYKKLVYHVVCSVTQDMNDVDDIAQEVFIRIYKFLDKYDPQFKFSTWVTRITRNICVDILRKKKISCVSMDEFEGLSSEEDTPEKMYIGMEKRQEIKQMIEELPEKYRQLIVLYHEKEMSYSQIADVLGKPLSIIKNRLYRARLILKERMLYTVYQA